MQVLCDREYINNFVVNENNSEMINHYRKGILQIYS